MTTAAATTTDFRRCPACSSTHSTDHPADAIGRVQVCANCGAIHGHAGYRGDLHKFVDLRWAEGPEDPEALQYFDLEFLGSEGLGRVHGWMDTTTRRVVQIG